MENAPQHAVYYVSVPKFKELFRSVWAFYKKNIWFLVILMFVIAVFAFGPLAVILVGYSVLSFVLWQTGAPEIASATKVLFGLLGILAALWTVVAYAAAQITMVNAAFKGKSAGLKAVIKESFDKTLLVRMIFGWLLYAILIVIGFMLFIIPGVFLLIPFTYWPYIMVKERPTIIEGIKRSWKMTWGFWWVTFLRVGWLALAIFAIKVAAQMIIVAGASSGGAVGGMLMLVVGLVLAAFSFLVSGPLMLIMTCRMYETVSGFTSAHTNARHKLSSGEIAQIVALIVLWLMVNSLGGSMSPKPYDEIRYNINDEYGSDFDEEEFERILQELEGEMKVAQ